MKWLYFLAALVILGCGKDNFESKPKLSIRKVEPEVVPPQGLLTVTFEFEDKEGDISDTLFYSLQRLNRRGPVTRQVRLVVPEFPARSTGEISVDFDYSRALTTGLTALRIAGSSPARFEPDTLRLAFMLQDKARNRSDTAVIERVIVIR